MGGEDADAPVELILTIILRAVAFLHVNQSPFRFRDYILPHK